MPRRWVSTKDLLEADDILTRPANPTGRAAVQAKAPTGKPVKMSATDKPTAKPTAKPGPGKMAEFEHDAPSLASRTRPELGSAADRHNSFHGAYHRKDARTHTKDRKKRIRALGGSSNVAFDAHLESGQRYIAKPHKGAAWGHSRDPFGNDISSEDRDAMSAAHEPHEWHRRHGSMYNVMSAMGAHHMVPVGFGSKMHGHLKDTLQPDEEDSAHKSRRMASTHADGDAHIQEHVGDHEVVGSASDKKLAGVDDEHRLHGMVAHTLFGHSDGHKENVLIHGSGHPIMIDHDFVLGSHYSKKTNEIEGMPAIVSVFAPGGKLDYRANRSDDVGVNFPPRMKKTLEWLASGGHMGGDDALSMSHGDSRSLRENAKNLLKHGLEGVLAKSKVKVGG